MTALAVGVALCLPGRAWSGDPEPNDSIAEAHEVVGDFVAGVRLTTADPDFFRFTGLDPELLYTATLDNPFLGLGWFAEDGTLLDSVAFEGFLELPDLVPDEFGELLIGVCGYVAPGESILDCSAEALGSGPYELTLPEPSLPLLALASLCSVFALAGIGRP